MHKKEIPHLSKMLFCVLIPMISMAATSCREEQNQNSDLAYTVWYGGYVSVNENQENEWTTANQLHITFGIDSIWVKALCLPKNIDLFPSGKYKYKYSKGKVYLNGSKHHAIEVDSISESTIIFRLVQEKNAKYVVPKRSGQGFNSNVKVADFILRHKNLNAYLTASRSDTLGLVFGKDTFYNKNEIDHANNEWCVISDDDWRFLVLDLLPWRLRVFQLDSLSSDMLYGRSVYGMENVGIILAP